LKRIFRQVHQYVKEFLKTVNMVNGKPCHPNEQGSVE
jgi:hypothetical protein